MALNNFAIHWKGTGRKRAHLLTCGQSINDSAECSVFVREHGEIVTAYYLSCRHCNGSNIISVIDGATGIVIDEKEYTR